MDENLPISIIEPASKKKATLFAENLILERKRHVSSQQTQNLDDIKDRLKKIREYTRENMAALGEELKLVLSRRYPEANLVSCAKSEDAVSYIKKISSDIKTISINNSSVVGRELRPGLIHDFTLYNSYLSEFALQEKTIADYWDIPVLLENKNNPSLSFDVSLRMNGLDGRNLAGSAVKKYCAVLGINAIGAGDGSVFFLQHFHNISRDLANAEKVILVIGLDKIVQTGEDAHFITECMGIFGMESVLLGIQPREEALPSVEELELPLSVDSRELHIILLDNGRTALSKTHLRDLLLCIGCRGCNRQCPIRYAFVDDDHLWTPRNYLQDFLEEKINSLDVCLHCEACRHECPVAIDLPGMMWEVKSRSAKKGRRSFYHTLLGNPELFAKVGTLFAPVVNRMMQLGLLRTMMEYGVGIERNANLPFFHRNPFRRGFKEE